MDSPDFHFFPQTIHPSKKTKQNGAAHLLSAFNATSINIKTMLGFQYLTLNKLHRLDST
jgi:hypothetical protein